MIDYQMKGSKWADENDIRINNGIFHFKKWNGNGEKYGLAGNLFNKFRYII